MPLFQQYFLHTSSGQKASIGFHDGTVIQLNQDTDAVLANPHLTQVKKGEIAEYLAPGTNHQVQQASTIAGAIGTAFDIRTDGNTTVFVVLHGALRVSNTRGAVVVKTNQQTVVALNAPPAPPTPADARAVFAWTQGIPTPDLGEDIALDASGGTIVGASSHGSGSPATRINDGLLTTGWRSAPGKVANQWVKLRFFGSSVYRIASVIIDPAATGGDSPLADLKDFQIKVSSTGTADADFTTVYNGRCRQEDSLQKFTFPVPVRARYLELVALNNWGDATHIDVSELEVVATASLFGQPQGIAVGPDGNLYVADSTANRIEKVSPSGKILAAWGSKGHNPGQFEAPNSLALDRQGNIYVADTFNDRIQKLSPQGKVLAIYGSSGLNPGQFIGPLAVALDSARNIYVTDAQSLQKLSPRGKPLGQWFSEDGLGIGFARGLAVDKSGHVWLADTENHRVLELGPDGSVLANISLQSTPTPLGSPAGIALDPSGAVYVVDSFQSRVVTMTSTGKVLATWGKLGSGRGEFLVPESIAFAPSGHVFVADTHQGRIEKFSPSGKLQGMFGKAATVPYVLGEAGGVAVDSRGDVYVTDEINDRLQIRSPSGGLRAVEGYYGFVATEKGTKGLGQFWEPHGVAVDSQGTIYVADTYNERIQILSNRGPIGAFGTKGNGPGQFLLPYGVAVDSQRNLYVVEFGNHRVQKFSPDGKKVLWTVGSAGHGTGQFFLPEGITVDTHGNVYVADTGNDRIVKLSAATGQVLDIWGPNPGRIDFSDRFTTPNAVATDAVGNVYVSDDGHEVIQKLSPTGTLLDEFFLPGPGANPNSITVDRSGNLYVGMGLSGSVVKLSPTGQLLSIWQ